MDHTIISYENCTTERLILWYLLFESYVPPVKYLKETGNYATGDFISLIFINSDVTERDIASEILSEIYCVYKVDGDTFPLTYQIIY